MWLWVKDIGVPFIALAAFSVGLTKYPPPHPLTNVGNGNIGEMGTCFSGLIHLFIYSTHLCQMPALCQTLYWFLGI